MKKVFLFAIAVVAISFASCSHKASSETEANADSLSTVVEGVEAAVAVDSTSGDTAVVVDEVVAVGTPAK